MAVGSLRERKKQRTRDAIVAAALELFAARGFGAVTLTEIATAADVGQRTLFRYFADKEELLFDAEDTVVAHLDAELRARPAGEPPAVALLEALASLTPFWQDRRAEGRVRQEIIDAAPALQARERAKHAVYERALTALLVERGTAEPAARLLARTAVACFVEAVRRWFADADAARPGLEARCRETFAEIAASFARTPPTR